MNILVLTFSLTTAFGVLGNCCHASTLDSNVVIVDGIRFETMQFSIDSSKRTATARLSLTSMKAHPRELKVNVYGTQLVDNERNAYYFATIALGRVLIQFEDRQNYLHYLLQPDAPVELTVTAQNISDKAEAIQVIKIVFEDSEEEGRFLEAYLTEPVVR